MNNKKDNPVPSLVKELLKESSLKLQLYGEVELALHINNYLQNGVETNKEQPKYTKTQIIKLCRVYFHGTKQLNNLLLDLG